MIKREQANKLWEIWQEKPFFKDFTRLLKEYDIFQDWTYYNCSIKTPFSYDYLEYNTRNYRPENYFGTIYSNKALKSENEANLIFIKILWNIWLFDNTTTTQHNNLSLSRSIYDKYKRFNNWRHLTPTYPNWQDKLADIDKYIDAAKKEEEERNKIWEDAFNWTIKSKDYEVADIDYKYNTSSIVNDIREQIDEFRGQVEVATFTPRTCASSLVETRPMNEPTGILCYLDFQTTNELTNRYTNLNSTYSNG